MTVSNTDEVIPTWFLVALFVVAVALAIAVIYLLFLRPPIDGPVVSLPTATATAQVGTATMTREATLIAEETATPAPIARQTVGAEPTPSPTVEPPTMTSEPAPTATAVEEATVSPTASPATSPEAVPTATQTVVLVAATVTPEAPTPAGTIEGQIALQGRSNHANVTLRVDGTLAGTTDASGTFSLDVPAGSHTIQASYPGYVIVEASEVEVQAGEIIRLPAGSLQAGDTDSDGDIDLYDVVRCVINMGRDLPTADMHADVNGDGTIDFRDLILIQQNYRDSSPVPWGS